MNQLSNSFPQVVVGTFQIKELSDIEAVLDHAFAVGYRAIDTASVYKNEHHIGNCLPKLLKKHNLERKDIFVTTKLGPKDLGSKLANSAIDNSLSSLCLDYVDLYLVHWPGKQGLKQDNPLNKQFRKEAWLELECVLKNSNKIKHLGVSNYQLNHLIEMSEYASVLPAVVQNEFHPDYQDTAVLEFCKKHNIHFQAYSPFGTSHLCYDHRFDCFSTIYKKSISQILLKWLLQKGCAVVPKSKQLSHMHENIDIFDFTITEEDMERIAALGKNIKYCWNSEFIV